MKKPIPFGKYMLLERVNVGGMAEVFKAKAFGVEGFERLVAVKRILPSIAEDQEFITMFIDEAKIAVQLTHANVAQIFDLGKVGDSYFIAMEFIHGKDLRAIFDRARKRGESVPVPMACYDVMKVCEGLDYAHNKRDAAGRELNLVHRDVSPQNILISYDGETKIIDFGIAKAAGKAGKTQAGILKGKFGYMSPEQVRGLPLDRRSDIFAVGICLYELLTGERLFVGESDFSTLEKVRNVEIMPPSTYNRRIPEELEQIVLKALAKDVDDRYQTAMDLHDDLQSFMYTSGNFFSRKDLSAYMRKAFAEEIAKESQREEEYRRMEAAAAVQGGGSGLEAFADLAPAASPSARPSARPSSSPSSHGRAANVSGPGVGSVPPRPPPPRSQKRTVMGMGAMPPPPPRTSGPPPPPPRPPQRQAPSPQPLPSQPAASASSSAGPSSGGAALDMDWDDEELSTQIYDKPEDGMIPALPDLGLRRSGEPPSPYQATPAPVATPAPSSSGATPGFTPPGARSGAPSPFDDLPVPAPRPHATEPRELGREPTAVTSREQKRGGGGAMAAVIGLVAVLGIALVGGGLWYFLRAQPGTINVATDPVDAVIYLDGNPATSSNASPFVLANVEPGDHLIEVRKHGYSTWATQVTLTSGQTMQLPAVTLTPEGDRARPPEGPATPPVAAAQGTGFSLDTVPSGAAVFVDETRLPQTTPVVVTDLAPGTHTVRAELENHAPSTVQIVVQANQITPVPRAVLTLRQVSVRFESDPSGARVTLLRGSERQSIGETPITAPVDTTGAQWTVEMTRAGHSDWSQPLSPPSGQASHTVRAELEREQVAVRPRDRPRDRPRPTPTTNDDPPTPTASGGPATLRVNSRPWSEVYVDGRRIGNTPQMNISVPAGRHTITFVNSEFNIREQVTVNVSPGQTETIIRTLTPG